MDFYTIVSIVAVVLLIIVLTLIAVYIPFTSATNYPTYMQPCPDSWTLGSNNTCTSIDDTTNANANMKDPNRPSSTLQLTNGKYSFTSLFPVSTFSYKNGLNTYTGVCGYNKWASDSSGIIWDGVSNYNKC